MTSKPISGVSTPDTRQWVTTVADELKSGDKISLKLEGNFERLRSAFLVNPREGTAISRGD